MTILKHIVALSAFVMPQILVAQQTWEPVVWRGGERTEVINGQLHKLSDIASRWDAGAYSQKLVAGDGAVRFSFAQQDKAIMCGLNVTSLNSDYRELDFALYGNKNGKLFIYEDGVKVKNLGDYMLSDVLSIERTGTSIEYKKNGVVVYTSLKTTSRTLFVDTAIHTAGAGVKNVELSGFINGDSDLDGIADSWEQELIDRVQGDQYETLADVDPYADSDSDYLSNLVEFNKGTDALGAAAVGYSPVVWTQLNGTEADAVSDYGTGSKLGKSSTKNGWNAEGIGAGGVITDGGFTFRFPGGEAKLMAGLSLTNSSAHHSDLDFALFANSNGNIYVFENGQNTGNFGQYSAADTFAIARVGSTVSYLRNGTVFYISETATSDPLIVDTSFHTEGAKLLECATWGSSNVIDSDSDGMDDTWEIAVINGSFTDNITTLAEVTAEGDIDSDGYTNLNEFLIGSSALVAVVDASQLTPVVWRDGRNVVTQSGLISKQQDASTGWNAGATSQKLMEANGVVQFTFGSDDAAVMCGLSEYSGNYGYKEIDYAFYGKGSGNLAIWEKGVKVMNLDSYDTNDRIAIVRDGTSILYYHNDYIVHTSQVAANRPLFVDCSLNKLGAQVIDTATAGFSEGDIDQDRLPDSWEFQLVESAPEDEIETIDDVLPGDDYDGDFLTNAVEYALNSDAMGGSSQGYEAVAWSSLNQVEVVDPARYSTGSDIRRVSGSGWSAGASSNIGILNDGGVTFRVSDISAKIMLGLNQSDDDVHFSDIEYAIYANSYGYYYVYENGVNIGKFGEYSQNDTFEVERSGSEVSYLHNGEVFYVSLVASSAPLYVDVSFGTTDSEVVNAAVWGVGMAGDVDNDGIPDAWEWAVINANPNDSVNTLADIDPTGDHDNDGMTNLQEYQLGVDALNSDSDDDGMLDGYEVTDGRSYNPNYPDNPEVLLNAYPSK